MGAYFWYPFRTVSMPDVSPRALVAVALDRRTSALPNVPGKFHDPPAFSLTAGLLVTGFTVIATIPLVVGQTLAGRYEWPAETWRHCGSRMWTAPRAGERLDSPHYPTRMSRLPGLRRLRRRGNSRRANDVSDTSAVPNRPGESYVRPLPPFPPSRLTRRPWAAASVNRPDALNLCHPATPKWSGTVLI